MTSKSSLLLIILLISLSTTAQAQFLGSTASSRSLPHNQQECRTAQSNCTDMVHPYLQNPQYMFPTNLDHVNDMCKMWSKFVDCIRRYISNCFEESRRVLFHKSVENSIDTVHAICSSKVYQNEYLAKAQCFRQVSIDYCGVNYQQLIDVVTNPNANDDHICCYYSQFKNCVNRPLLEECGRKAKNLMDHSMSFLISRCNYYSHQSSKECTKAADFAPNSIANEEAADAPPESSAVPATNFQSSNNIETAASSRIETANSAANFETSSLAEVDALSQSQSREMNPASLPPPDAEVSVENNNIDESEGRSSAEQLIVYTMKPESQIGSLDFSSGSVGSFGFFSVTHSLIGHAVRLGLIVGWIQWLQL